MGRVWIGRKIQSNGKWFLLTVKCKPLKCKIVYTSILPSNQLHPFSAYLNWERESLNLRPEPRCRCLKPTATWSPYHHPLEQTLVISILSLPEAYRHLTDLFVSISSPMTDLVISISSPMTDLSLSWSTSLFPSVFDHSLFLPLLLVWPNFLV